MKVYNDKTNSDTRISHSFAARMTVTGARHFADRRSARDVADRFISSAALFPAGSFLGWESAFVKNGRPDLTVFSKNGPDLTKEDCDWIFDGFAFADTLTYEPREQTDGDPMTTYALVFVPVGRDGAEAGGDRNDEPGDRKKSEPEATVFSDNYGICGISSLTGLSDEFDDEADYDDAIMEPSPEAKDDDFFDDDFFDDDFFDSDDDYYHDDDPDCLNDNDIDNGDDDEYVSGFVRDRDDEYEQADRSQIESFLTMAEQCGAVVGALAHRGERQAVSGLILIHLNGEMPLRMRVSLAQAFPSMTPVKLRPGRGSSDGIDLPADPVISLTSALIDYLDGKAKNEDDSDHEISDHTPIEDLDLSVRSFNCLRRAGIGTVGDIRGLSYEKLRSIRNLSLKCANEILEKIGWTPDADKSVGEQKNKPAEPDRGSAEKSAEPEQRPSDARAELDRLIGLDGVKEQLRKIEAFAKMKAALKDGPDEKKISLVLNMEFRGNPGTAKTTVARILAKRFYELGLLKSPDPVEVGRADLVAEYVGHTAKKVRDVFESASGKMLFIDEAYSLAEANSGSFADEAIDTIVQEMENRREDTIVIFAGYPKEMDEFFARNPGLRSRVPFKIVFGDYTPDEMVKICVLEAESRGFPVHPDAIEKIRRVCETESKKPSGGNGRLCRNLTEKAVLNYALRVCGSDGAPQTVDLALIADDYDLPDDDGDAEKTRPIGF